jgi:hypothetical protein
MHRRRFSQFLIASTTPAVLLLEQACSPAGVQKSTAAPATSTSTDYPVGDVRRYGADPTGTADSTVAFQLALNATGRVVVSDGTYLIQAGSITVPIGVELAFSRSSTVRIAASGPSPAFQCLGRNRIQGGYFTSANDYAVVAGVLGGVSDVAVSGIACEGCRILYATTTAATYAAADDDNSPARIRVSDCTATAGTIATNMAAIQLLYCRNSSAWGNRLESYTSGIQWWGGDAAVDGLDISRPRKTRNLQILGNAVSNSVSGGIWGSMGTMVTVSGNTVDGCNDVCLDFEGCVNCSAVGNTISDGHNACLAAFFSNAGIVFASNICTVTDAAFPLFRIFNSSQSVANNLDITVTGNSFSCASGAIGTITQSGPCRNLNFSGNTLRNVRIAWSGANNFHFVAIRNNVLTFDVQPSGSLYALECTGGFAYAGIPAHVTIGGNQVLALGSMPLAGAGISVDTSDYNAGSVVTISENVINGFAADIATQERGANAGVSGIYAINRNRLGAGVYARTESGARCSSVKLTDNLTAAGLPFPTGIPLAGYWDVGQIVWFDPTAQNTAPGAVCVQAGAPGLWMHMAGLQQPIT